MLFGHLLKFAAELKMHFSAIFFQCCNNCNLYSLKEFFFFFLRIFHSVVTNICNPHDALCSDFLGLIVITCLTYSISATRILGWPLRFPEHKHYKLLMPFVNSLPHWWVFTICHLKFSLNIHCTFTFIKH